MRRSVFFLLIPLLSLTAPAQAADSEVTVVGALDFAFKDMTLDAGGGGGSKFNTTLTTINPGVAIAYGRVYGNINFDKSIDSASTTQIDQGLPSMLTMSRSDTVLTLGYRVLDSVSLYAGWLSGDIGAYLAGERLAGSPTPTPTFYTQEINYTEKGPFAGFALSHGFGDKGSISFSLAYAKLNGEMSQTKYTGGTAPGTTYEKGSADVKGLSYSLIWTGPLNGSMNYRLGVKSTRYEGNAMAGSSVGINEYYTAFFLGLNNTF